MRILYKKSLIAIIGVFLIALTTSTAVTTVAEESYWGNLKAGDEMIWVWGPGWAHTGWRDSTYELEILEIQGERLRVDHHHYEHHGSDFEMRTIESGTTTLTSDDLEYDILDYFELTTTLRWIYPVSLMRENENIKTRTFEFDGSNYKAAYIKEEDSDGGQHEFWWDYNTGILFKYNNDYDMSTVTYIGLDYTNADLTEPTRRRFCFGSIFIIFVSIAALVSYSIKFQQKRKKP